MTAQVLIERLHGVRRTGAGRWVANCPAHDDHNSSLNVRELDDGRVLAHCFGGCAIEKVLDAVGLDFSALFPNQPHGYRRGECKPWRVADVLTALEFELTVCLAVLADVHDGRSMSEADRSRAGACRERVVRFIEALRRAC